MKTLLYVEDNDDNIYMLRRRLRRHDFSLLEARNGEQGVERARQLQPQLIIMDLILPGIDGWETTRRIKADPETAQIPIIALSSNASTEDRASSLAAGCDDFDTKPVDLERLLLKINTLLP